MQIYVVLRSLYLVSLGPIHLESVLRKASLGTTDALLDCGQAHPRIWSLYDTLNCHEFLPYHARHSTEENHAWMSGEKMVFDGNDQVHKPNWGWIAAHGGRAEVCCTDSGKSALRRRGYVIWDKERLERDQTLAI